MRVDLPIDPLMPEIVGALRGASSLVLVAEPGAGKTTRVPPAIVSMLSGDAPNLVLLQPRRVAARAAAQRMAEENGWEIGGQVGYQVRFEKRIGPRTRIRVLTEGILARQLLDDPFLPGVGCVILDEFHERSLHTDIALALLREVRETVRPDLRLVVMSATLDAEPVAAFLAAPVIRVPGRTFPIEIRHDPPTERGHAGMIDHTARTVLRAMSHGSGASRDILVFLPGTEEIRRVGRQLEGADAATIPLHGSLALEEQQRALRPDPQGRQKIILATNIAETSLTIDGVALVIDSGLARVASYDAGRGLDRLTLKRISRASAAQRAGRAGRTGPGRCIRLWSAAEDRNLKPFELPEVRRVDLAGTVLSLHAWGKSDPRAFNWFEPPAEEALAAAESLLLMLGALAIQHAADGAQHSITPLGRRMVDLPAHPRLARLLLAAGEQNLWHEGATLAALLSEKDILRRDAAPERGPQTQASSDLLVRMHLLADAERHNFPAHFANLDRHAARQVVRARDEFLRILRHAPRRCAVANSASSASEETLLRLILTAYPDRVVRRRENDAWSGVTLGNRGVRLARESAVLQPPLYLALDARHDDRAGASVVTLASAVKAEWLATREEKSAELDGERIVAVTRVLYGDLVLSEKRHGATGDVSDLLASVIRQKARELVAGDEGAQKLLARVALLRTAMPEHPWPIFDDAQLADLLAPLAAGRRSLEQVRGANLVGALEAALPYPLDRLLDEHAPEAIAVPTGNRIRIDYAPALAGNPPILAVRLQEIFGWKQTPRIAGGRVALLLHLLSPGYRPVQITRDLESFWSNAYFQVRKDLRAQYPKHSWPEDPLTAAPVAKGGRRRS